MISLKFHRSLLSAVDVEWDYDGTCDAFKLQQRVEHGPWVTKYIGRQNRVVIKELDQSTCMTFQVHALSFSEDEYTVIQSSDVQRTATLADTPSVAALQRAIKKGQNHLLETMFAQKPHLVDIIFANQLSVLGLAVMSSNELAVPILLNHGANVELGCLATRKTPLHLSMAAGHLKLAKTLLTHQANLAAVDKIGHNVVHFAVTSNNLEAVKFCWLHKADFEAADCMGWTPLLWAVITNAKPAIVDYLVANGCQRSIKDKNDLSVSQHAQLSGRAL